MDENDNLHEMYLKNRKEYNFWAIKEYINYLTITKD